ncbi:MAG: glycosyltransferase family 39 protein [Deltaproteobacteria bacterium]|nr:glycosyltransferase family 39 protein [Deltaproteobacteria bacterium]
MREDCAFNSSRQGLPLAVSCLLVLGFFLRLFYLSYTDYDERMYDVTLPTGHLDYITHVATTLSLPNPLESWEYHQPPLYYCLAAAIFKITSSLEFSQQVLSLQLLSLAFAMIFLIVAAKCFHLLFASTHSQILANSFVIFWPSSILHSTRIGNDASYYAIYSIGFYFVLKYFFSNKPTNLVIASIFAALSTLTKANGLILVSIVLAAMLLAIRRRDICKDNYGTGVSIFVILLLGVALSFGDNFYWQLQHGASGTDWLLGDSLRFMNPELRIRNDFLNFFYFDVIAFLSNPFADTWQDEAGRQYFLTTFLKTSLFGEWKYADTPPTCKYIAQAISAMLLLIIPCTIYELLCLTRRRGPFFYPMLLNILIPFIFILCYRVKTSVAPASDFRYILPSLLSMAFFYTKRADGFAQAGSRVATVLMYLLLALFVIFSASFFIALSFEAPRSSS